MAPPGPVKIGHKKDCRRRRPHRFHVSRPPLPGRWIRYWTTNQSRFLVSNVKYKQVRVDTKLSRACDHLSTKSQ